MSRHHRTFGRIAVVAALVGWMLSVGALAQQESSVLVEKKAEPAADAPVLTPPAQSPTLPPPQEASPQEANKPEAENGVRGPFLRPAPPRDPAHAELGGQVEAIPAPAGSSVGPAVRPAPPIRYDTDGDARRMYRRNGEVELIMVTKNPADGCLYEIPLCIPACCTGQPTVAGGQGIFGRGVVEYCWPCGFRAIVKFRHVLGDVRVDYEGD
jgi:hypothetical protein